MAADYPSRPIKWVVGYPPGGATDIIARLIGQRLQEKLGQTVVIENKPGAGNNIATESVINAEPDGYTVLLVNPANYINTSLYANLKFNVPRDIAPVASFNRVPNVMTVNKDVPAKTVAEFIAYVKANPGKVNLASSGNGTSVHLSGEMFMAMTGAKMQHVPYRGAALALTDLIGGQVQVIFDNMPSVIQHIKSGAVRGSRSRRRTRSDCCRIRRPSPTPCPAMKRARCSAWARRRTRRRKSSPSSMPRSTRSSPSPRSRPS